MLMLFQSIPIRVTVSSGCDVSNTDEDLFSFEAGLAPSIDFAKVGVV